MTVFEKIISLLNSKKVRYQLIEHEPVHTSAQAALVRGTAPEQGAKALVMCSDGVPVMLVLPGNLKVDLKSFKSKFGIKNLQMALPEEVEKITGVKIGAVPPFGNLFNLKLFVDTKLGINENIAFNAGDHSKSIVMSYHDFASLTSPIISDFSI